MAAVRPAGSVDVAACVAIVEALPDHFTPDVPARVARDLAEHHGWVAEDDGRIVGFVAAATRFPRAAEILWAAVAPDRRGRGVGTVLVTTVVAELARAGARVVEVKTLDPGAGYAPYEATYAFWTARGFVQIDTIDPLPAWGPGSPAAILVAIT